MKKTNGVIRGLIMMLIGVFILSATSASFSTPFVVEGANEDHLLLVDGTEGRDYGLLFNVLGIPYESKDIKGAILDDLHRCDLVIVPKVIADHLTEKQITNVSKCIKKGGNILIEGQTDLAEALGIEYTGETISANSGYQVDYPDRIIRWPKLERIAEILVADKGISLFRSLGSNKSLSMIQTFGQGKVLYLSRPIVSDTGDFYQYFPYVHESIEKVLESTLRLRKDTLVTYFDWGYYYNTSPKEVTRDFRQKGINQVHISGWYDTPDYWSYVDQFIDHAHSNGIRVYLWLELPMVTEKFWNDHPEWRQMTAGGEEAKIDWRYLMALENPGCMSAVKAYYQEVLNRYDWDGVDLAELYFESPGYGIDLADLFTPMSDTFRETYKSKYAIDPIEIFNPSSSNFYGRNLERKDELLNERKNLLTALNESFLVYFETAIDKELDVVLTMIDVEVDPNMSDNIGIDTSAFINLLKGYHFTLNIEDPFTLWSLGPERYKLISDNYRKIIGDGEALTVDINIVNRVDTEMPHSKQTGVEFLNLLWESSKSFDQVAIYASHTPYDNDFNHASYALAHPQIFEVFQGGLRVVTDQVLFLEIPLVDRRVFINGRPWPLYNDEGIFIPPGSVFVEIIESPISPLIKVVDVRGEIDSATVIIDEVSVERGTSISYKQKQALYIGLETSQISLEIDGIETEPQWYFNGETYYLQLPKGQHTVNLRVKNSTAYEIILEGKVQNELRALTKIRNGIWMISAGRAADLLGGRHVYDGVYQTTTINLGYYSLWARNGALYGKANGADYQFIARPFAESGDVWLPLNDFFQALGYEVLEDGQRIMIE
jgi:hypothetical protein